MSGENKEKPVYSGLTIDPTPAPPPLIERLKKEATEPTQVAGSQIFYFFGQSHLIGRGGNCYGVFKGYHKLPERKAAVKLIPWTDDSVFNELEIMASSKSSDHPGSKYLVQLYEYAKGTVLNGDRPSPMIHVAMDLAKCNLDQELLYCENYSDNFPKFQGFLKNIASGIEYLHHRNIVHRDIKPQNVLIFENEITGESVAKLGDMGLCRQMSRSEGTISYGNGTEIWMSPEALRAIDNEEEFLNTKAMDIFSFGLVAYYTLYYREHPFDQNGKLRVNIKDDNVTPDEMRMKRSFRRPLSAVHLVWWMLQKDPARRPSIQQCRQHPFFWENAEEKTLQFFTDIVDVLWARKDEDDESNDESMTTKIGTMVRFGVNHGVASHYRTELRNSLFTAVLNRCAWNWQDDIDPQLVRLKSEKEYNGFGAIPLVKFIVDLAQNPDDMADGVVERLFRKAKAPAEFCRIKYMRYFMNEFQELSFLLFFTLARISAEYPHLKELEEKYFKEYAGRHENWDHGIITRCIEKMLKEIERRGQLLKRK